MDEIAAAPAVDAPDLAITPPEDATPPAPENPYKGTKHKFKANGKEIEVDYDDLLSKASLAEGANQKFQEAKVMRKELEDKLGRLSNAEADNLDEIIETLGIDKVLKIANTISEKELYWNQLSEEEREDLLYRQKADAALNELEALKGKERQAAQQQAQIEAYNVINDEIGEALALAKAEGVPLADLPEIAEGIVDEMLAFLEFMEREEKEGRKLTSPPPSAKDVVKKLQSKYEERSGTYLKKLNAKQLKSMLSPEQLADLRKEEIDGLYGSNSPRRTSQQADEVIKPFSNQDENQSKPRKSDDWFKQMDKKLGVRK